MQQRRACLHADQRSLDRLCPPRALSKLKDLPNGPKLALKLYPWLLKGFVDVSIRHSLSQLVTAYHGLSRQPQLVSELRGCLPRGK